MNNYDFGELFFISLVVSAALFQFVLPYLFIKSIGQAGKEIIEVGNEIKSIKLNEAGKNLEYGASLMILLFWINLVLVAISALYLFLTF